MLDTVSQSNQGDIMEQLSKPEVQESLKTLLEHLPKLTELVTFLSTSYDLAKSIATDEVLKNETISAIKGIAGPATQCVKNIAATAIEAKDRAEHNNEVIGIFGLLKMLKDPQAQKLLRFIQAYLEVLAEQDAKKSS